MRWEGDADLRNKKSYETVISETREMKLLGKCSMECPLTIHVQKFLVNPVIQSVWFFLQQHLATDCHRWKFQCNWAGFFQAENRKEWDKKVKDIFKGKILMLIKGIWRDTKRNEGVRGLWRLFKTSHSAGFHYSRISTLPWPPFILRKIQSRSVCIEVTLPKALLGPPRDNRGVWPEVCTEICSHFPIRILWSVFSSSSPNMPEGGFQESWADS